MEKKRNQNRTGGEDSKMRKNNLHPRLFKRRSSKRLVQERGSRRMPRNGLIWLSDLIVKN